MLKDFKFFCCLQIKRKKFLWVKLSFSNHFGFRIKKQRNSVNPFKSENYSLLLNKLSLFFRRFKQWSDHKATNRVVGDGKFGL